MTRALHAVPTLLPEPAPDMSYEWRDRQRIRAKDWARVHIAADRRAPIYMPDRVRRLWRR